MAFTTAQLDAIEEAIGNGELEVQFEGKVVKYRSFADLKAARDLIKSELIASGALQESNPPRSYAGFCRD